MRCQHCATELTDDSLYCPKCGIAVHGATIAAATSGADNVVAMPMNAPALPDALSGRALTGMVAREYDDAAGALVPLSGTRGLKRLNAFSVHSLLTQANLHRMRGQFTEAVDCCVTVLRVQPANATAHSLLGDIYRDQDKLDDAIQWYHMAVELRPNSADKTKLSETERQRQSIAGGAQRARRAARGTGSLAAVTGLNTGTSNLMGVSPRRWLRGIWITSLAFLTIVLVALVAMQSQRHDIGTHNKTQASSSGFGSGLTPSGLPPLDLSQPPTSSSQQASGTTAGTGGGLGAAHLPHMADGSSGQASTAPLAPNVPTAPVLDVKPLESGALASGQAPRDHSVTVTPEPLQPMRLTGNLALLQVQNLGNGTAAVMVEAPRELATDASDTARELLVRNVFRSARTAFAGNNLYTRATVFIQTQIPAAGGEAVLMEAGLDRTAATEAMPDTDTLTSLTTRLQSLKWAAPAAAGAAATDTTGIEITTQPNR